MRHCGLHHARLREQIRRPERANLHAADQGADRDGGSTISTHSRISLHTGVLPAAERTVWQATWLDRHVDGFCNDRHSIDLWPITWFRRLDPNGQKWQMYEIEMPEKTGSGKGICIYDLDLDGKNDVAFTCEHSKGLSGVCWLKSPGDWKSSQWERNEISGAKSGVKFDLIQSLDLDGDGDLDIATCEEVDNLGVIWYENPRR